MATQQVSTEQLREYITLLLAAHNLTIEEFESLGASGELAEIEPNLEFAYKAVWPLVKGQMAAA